MAQDDEPARSHSRGAALDTPVRHAVFAILGYAGVRALTAISGGLQQPAIAMWFVIDLAIAVVVAGALGFGIHRRSRIAVVLAIIYVVATQLYIWLGIGTPAGTVIAVIATGFLLRGAKSIFAAHAADRAAESQAP